jgi:hypothetical protein
MTGRKNMPFASPMKYAIAMLLLTMAKQALQPASDNSSTTQYVKDHEAEIIQKLSDTLQSSRERALKSDPKFENFAIRSDTVENLNFNDGKLYYAENCIVDDADGSSGAFHAVYAIDFQNGDLNQLLADAKNGKAVQISLKSEMINDVAQNSNDAVTCPHELEGF